MAYRAAFCKFYQKMPKKPGLEGDDEPEPDVRCTYCTRKVRIVDFDDLRPGDHISMGGKRCMFNFEDSQVTLYKHHSIVKRIEKLNKTSCMATLIHFYSLSFDDLIKIRKTTELLDLGTYDIFKVRYSYPTNTPEKIIERAELLLNSGKSYSPVTCNCEHFCHWCCIGVLESFQVNEMFDVLRNIGTGAWTTSGKILKIVAKIITKSRLAGVSSICVPWGILSVFAIGYLIFCIYRHHCLNKEKKLGKMCSRCCSQQVMDLWSRFLLYCTAQACGVGLLALISSFGASMGIVGVCTVVVSVVSIALMVGIPKLKAKLSSPFIGPMVTMKSIENISIGDVISFKYKLRMHDGLVSNIEKMTETRGAKISVIHYSQPRVIGRREVLEETLDVNIPGDIIKRHDYSGYTCHPPEIVVQRARQRLGEKKYDVFSNRSCHFCHWAKVNEDVHDEAPQECQEPTTQLRFDRRINMGDDLLETETLNVDHSLKKKHSTRTMGSSRAHIPQEVKEGSLIKFKYGVLQLWHFAVTTEIEYPDDPSSLVDVTVVHCGKGSRPCEEKIRFDLRHDDVWIHKYFPLYRYSRKEVVIRARARIGHGNLRSFQLAEDIVRKQPTNDTLVEDFSMVKKGDVIIFYYWSLKHAAIVVRVGESISKANTIADVTIIHYALDGLFSKRTIKQETILMDLSRDQVYRRVYEDLAYQPSRVISRAKSRLDEQLFNMRSNTSWDLVHWAKVVQTPAIVNKSFEDETCQTSGPGGETMALFPLVGKARGRFQRVPVYEWRDLQPGIIIEYSYYWIWHEAILTDVDYKAKKITVIHYGTDTIFSTRTIMKDTFCVDLHKNQLWMYRCDPTVCNPPAVIVALANERLGEQKWGSKNKSWHFCNDCVLKKRSKSLERKYGTDT